MLEVMMSGLKAGNEILKTLHNESTSQFALVIEYYICLYQYVKLIANGVVTYMLPVEVFANRIKNFDRLNLS